MASFSTSDQSLRLMHPGYVECGRLSLSNWNVRTDTLSRFMHLGDRLERSWLSSGTGPKLPVETTTMPRRSFPEPVTRASRRILCHRMSLMRDEPDVHLRKRRQPMEAC